MAVILTKMSAIEHPICLHLKAFRRAYELEKAPSTQLKELKWIYGDILWREKGEKLPCDEVSCQHEAPVLCLQGQVVRALGPVAVKLLKDVIHVVH